VYFLVRKQTGRGSGEALETEYQGDALTLGGDPGVMVHLPGVKGTVELQPEGNSARARVSARRVDIDISGERLRKARIGPGDMLRVGAFELSLFAPPVGFQLGLLLKQVGEAQTAYAGALELSDSAWSVRRLGWAIALLVLVLCLIVPLLVLFFPEVATALRDTPLPDDGLWSSGPLDAAHATSGIADDCQSCHSEPFVMVQDAACLRCHRSITEHVDITVHPAEVFTSVRCATCHREHNEPERLVRTDNGLCVDCHADAGRWTAAEELQAVSRFTAAGHPEFRLGLLTPQGPGAAYGWEVERVPPRGTGISERSNLKFNHAVHLDEEKVRTESGGEPLVCSSCHMLKDDDEHFETVNMDEHCRSCHSLSFDIFDPDIELPHGDLRAAVVAMEAHFIREFTDPELRREREAQKPRRVPGKRESAASCEGDGLSCGRAEALKEAQYQFAETGCVTCHEVTETGLDNIFDRWVVQPVRVTGDWYPFSRFDHHAHLSLSRASEQERCATCHEVQGSELATDILMPAQDTCLACHDDAVGNARVECVACHRFHQDSGPPSILVREKG
jgi:predicted CXXCH cytochrome family protein